MDDTARSALPQADVAPVVVFLLGHLVLLLALPRRPPLPVTIAAEAVVSLPLVVALARRSPALPAVGVFAATLVATVAAVATAGRATDALWPAATVAVVTLGFVAYAIHRYELVRLGLITETGTEIEPGADTNG